MKTRTWLITIVATVLVVGGGLAVYKKRQAGAAAAGPSAAGTSVAGTPGASAATAAPVIEFSASDLLTLAPATLARTIPMTGSLRPANQTTVRSKAAGEIRELAVREGDTVKAGQLIARIDPIEFEWRVKEREAQLRSAQAQLDQAKRTLENNKALLEKNFISQSAFDNANSLYDVAIGARDAAVAQLTMARKSLADTVVHAPMNGVVAERFAQVGEKVSPDNRIVSIMDLSRMEIEAPVPASEIGAVSVGQSVELSIEGISQRQVGRIVRINPVTQAGTRSVPVYIGLDNKDPRVRAGLFAQGSLQVGSQDNILVIPVSAVRDAAGRLYVYAIEGNQLVEKDVKLGQREESAMSVSGSAGLVEVRQGLKAGDRIVAVNLGTLRAGSTVRTATRAGAQ